MQKHVNLVDLVKSFPTNIYLQNLASIQKRTSPVKFARLAVKLGKGSISNLSTKARAADAAERRWGGREVRRGGRAEGAGLGREPGRVLEAQRVAALVGGEDGDERHRRRSEHVHEAAQRRLTKRCSA